jgi:hypothetical protein
VIDGQAGSGDHPLAAGIAGSSLRPRAGTGADWTIDVVVCP